jgi:hypothetical protein
MKNNVKYFINHFFVYVLKIIKIKIAIAVNINFEIFKLFVLLHKSSSQQYPFS